MDSPTAQLSNRAPAVIRLNKLNLIYALYVRPFVCLKVHILKFKILISE